MTSHPRPAALHALVLFLTLGCASAPGARAEPVSRPTSRPASAQEAEADGHLSVRVDDQDHRSIRFGDPEHLEYTADFFPGTTYDASIPTPESLLEQPVGSRPAAHAEVLSYLRILDAASDRIQVHRYGRTHEGRELIYAVIGSEANLARLADIQTAMKRLADPRGLSDAEADRLLAELPAFAWAGYSIHGDEMSGVDAAIAVAHHLVAGTSADVTGILEDVLVVMDPQMNPDGRARFLSQLVQNAGYVANLDYSSLHRGRWPGGRGNHYLFDMNRDWMPGIAPETRGRWKVLREFPPQLFLDAHEMGALDTFLFYPPNEPINKNVPQRTRAWWKTFGDEQAAAFDAHGWSYYTREWAEYWFPGYSDSWGTFNGAIGILYEQARYDGQSLRRASGEIVTYREAVHHQAVSTLANLASLARHRDGVLRDWLTGRRENVADDTPGNDRMFVLELGRHPQRERKFVAALAEQGIEVLRTDRDFVGANVLTLGGATEDEHAFAAGVLIVPAKQPQGPLLKAYLDFDPRYDEKALRSERDELEKKGETKIYDLTGWSMAHAFDIDAYWADAVDVASTRVEALSAPDTWIVPPPDSSQPIYGWIVDGTDDGSVAFAARAMELSLAVHASDEPFRSAGRDFVRGSLLVRRHENGEGVAERVAAAAGAARVQAFATGSGRSPDDGPDLGGGEFMLLARPRIALLGNAPLAPDTYGHLWHQLDAELGTPFTLLDAAALGAYDLRRYNVLVVPPGGGSVLSKHAKALDAWVEAGGTLVATGSSAAALADEELGLSAVRRRRDALEELEQYAWAVDLARRAGEAPIDAGALWDGVPSEAGAEGEESGEDDGKDDEDSDASTDPDPERLDEWKRLFAPHGVVLRTEVNTNHWITAGCREELAVNFSGSSAYLHDEPAETAVRMAPPQRLRIAGLLWPEARERIADTAYLTVEPKGHGQVILFAAQPGFRGLFRGTGRLFANAVIYGPGLGADQPSDW